MGASVVPDNRNFLDRTWRLECLYAETTPYEALRKIFPI